MESRVHAPYNFVPFSEQVLLRYGGEAELPRHDRLEPGLKTGELQVSVTAETPVLAAGGEDRSRFCRDGEGRVILPGSTLRGLVRMNLQVLGFGLAVPGEDFRDLRGRFSPGLPPRHRALLGQERPLDYPRALLGYAGRRSAYRSRVAFGDLPVQGKNPLPEPPVRTVPGQPRPGWHWGYLEDGAGYEDADFRLRGYKHYWMKETVDRTYPGKPSITAEYRPLPAGTVFRGRVRFRNLHEDELGLLLWALELEKDFGGKPCWQSVGTGRPYGYGRVRICVEELVEWDWTELYSFDGLQGGGRRSGDDPEKTVKAYVETYQRYALDKLRKDQDRGYLSLLEYPEIQDFLFLHCVQEDVDGSYMTWREYQTYAEPLPSAASFRRQRGEPQAAAVPEPQEEKSMEELLAALKDHFKKV